jgi:hypothetical protein
MKSSINREKLVNNFVSDLPSVLALAHHSVEHSCISDRRWELDALKLSRKF